MAAGHFVSLKSLKYDKYTLGEYRKSDYMGKLLFFLGATQALYLSPTFLDRLFYSCLFGELAFGRKRRWDWPCFDRNLSVLLMLI